MCLIKLNANENPYPPSPKVCRAIASFDASKLNVYPSSSCEALCSALAKYHGLDDSQVFVANGSDEVIAFCFMAFFNSDLPILFPDITYSFYPVWASLFKTNYKNPSLDENFRINPRDYDVKNGGIILPNPNAPTGIGEGVEFLEDILKNNQDVIVIIDEAYVDFHEFSAVSLLSKYENLVVVQTYSKARSLAGLRIGAAFASKELIAVLNAVKNSYNSYTLDAIAQTAAIASISDDDYFKECIARVKSTRRWTTDALRELGFFVFDSSSNFVLAEPPSGVLAKELMEKLKEDKIFIRYFNINRITNHLRISIGTDEQMQKMIAAIKKYI